MVKDRLGVIYTILNVGLLFRATSFASPLKRKTAILEIYETKNQLSFVEISVLLFPLHCSHRAVNPPFLEGSLPVLEAVSLSPYFKRNPPVFGNNQLSNIKVIVYGNDMRKNSLFSFSNFLGPA